MFFGDAASCFPNNAGFQWDGAFFNLDLRTGKLFVDVSTYPNQFGACRENSFSLTAAEFNEIAIKYNMSQELQYFKTDEDWAKLFDENLNSVISDILDKKQKQEEERQQEEIMEM